MYFKNLLIEHLAEDCCAILVYVRRYEKDEWFIELIGGVGFEGRTRTRFVSDFNQGVKEFYEIIELEKALLKRLKEEQAMIKSVLETNPNIVSPSSPLLGAREIKEKSPKLKAQGSVER